jgi:insulysin
MKLPINETRKFKYGELKNGIKYAIISDQYAEKATMATAVKTGSYFDPENYDGLAHFLEHMLFLGSKKYPKEDYFDDKLKKYGGSSNAFTAPTETVYYFNVNDNYLDEIIDIFSHFFIDPLFDEDSVSREINAVNSEHNKNITNDNWIRRQIIKNISKKNSPINRFSTGNFKTLNKPDIRNKMIEFYN